MAHFRQVVRVALPLRQERNGTGPHQLPPLFGQRVLLATISTLVVFTACGGALAPSQSQRSGEPNLSARAPVRITAAIRGSPPVLANKLNIGNNFVGTAHLERLVGGGLANPDERGNFHPQLAEAVPTVDNGLWRLLDDGRMETTWRLREGARWHDGAPLSAEDVVFTSRVERDPELALVRNTAYEAVESVQAVDARTILVTWKQPFIEADAMFSAVRQRALPLPRHILQSIYEDDRAGFVQHAYWNSQYVGSGPYRVREWATDSHVILDAFDGYVLGRPKIDSIEVRFIPDSNTVMANILAGTVEYTMDGRTISFEEARSLAAQWREGRIELGPGAFVLMFPQFLNASPSLVAQVGFRRALMHAVDRQEMVDTIQGGLAAVAHTSIGEDSAEYGAVGSRIVRHDYDVARAARLFEESGLSRAADGTLRDGSGNRLVVPLHTTVTQINQKATLAVTDYWQRAGVNVDMITIPLQRQNDREYMFTLPAFHLIRVGRDVSRFRSYSSRESPLPENNFSGSNRGRYQNAELDTLIDRYFTAIPKDERMHVLGDIISHETSQLVTMPLFFDPESTMVANRVKNVPGGAPWNAHLWEVI